MATSTELTVGREPSGLVLSIPEEFAEGRDNGLFQVWEIFESVRLDADLVVLSACETGIGEIRGGEGIIELTWVFQFAGARSVLASLWRVEDEATAELMQRFYRHLRAGKAKDEALWAAQLELIRRPLRVPDGRGGWTERNAAARTSGPPCNSSATTDTFFYARLKENAQ